MADIQVCVEPARAKSIMAKQTHGTSGLLLTKDQVRSVEEPSHLQHNFQHPVRTKLPLAMMKNTLQRVFMAVSTNPSHLNWSPKQTRAPPGPPKECVFGEPLMFFASQSHPLQWVVLGKSLIDLRDTWA